jgi:hypothetical protein
MVETWGLPYEDEAAEGVEVISDRVIGTRRWSIDHELIFRVPEQPKGQAWMTTYSVGATESQDESPWQYENRIEVTLVREVEKTIKVWEPAP